MDFRGPRRFLALPESQNRKIPWNFKFWEGRPGSTESHFWSFLIKISRKSHCVRALSRGCWASDLCEKIGRLVFLIVYHHNIMGKLQLGHANEVKSTISSKNFFCDAKFLNSVVTYLWEREMVGWLTWSDLEFRKVLCLHRQLRAVWCARSTK